jgi:hypothetical protein
LLTTPHHAVTLFDIAPSAVAVEVAAGGNTTVTIQQTPLVANLSTVVFALASNCSLSLAHALRPARACGMRVHSGRLEDDASVYRGQHVVRLQVTDLTSAQLACLRNVSGVLVRDGQCWLFQPCLP